jgi:hypothetical protein
VYADRWDNFNEDSTLGSAPVASSAAATSVCCFSHNVMYIATGLHILWASLCCVRERGREKERVRDVKELTFVYAGVFFHCYAPLHWNDCLLFRGTNRPQMVNAQRTHRNRVTSRSSRQLQTSSRIMQLIHLYIALMFLKLS